MQIIDECCRIDIKPIGQTEQTAQTEISFTAFHRADECEVQADPVGKLHLTEPLTSRSSRTRLPKAIDPGDGPACVED